MVQPIFSNFILSECQVKYKPKIMPNDLLKVNSSNILIDQLRGLIGDRMFTQEVSFAAYLNRNMRLLCIRELSTGSSTGTMIEPKMVFQNALLVNANCFIIAHNHPSGNNQPSGADKTLTANMKKAGEIMDIQLVDSLIITYDSYFSFADHKLI